LSFLSMYSISLKQSSTQASYPTLIHPERRREDPPEELYECVCDDAG
jgi:hypothetical protein